MTDEHISKNNTLTINFAAVTSDATPEQTAFLKKIESDFKNANIPLPKHFTPFPQQNLAAEGYQKGNTVVGISTNGSFVKAVKHTVNTGLFSNLPTCADNKINNKDILDSVRTYVVLHELGHYIDKELKLTSNIQDYAAQHVTGKTHGEDAKTLIKSNVRERLADMTAAIYIKSNFPDKKDTVDFVMNIRQVHTHDISHNTVLSLGSTKKNEYTANLSIVESAIKASKILETQKDDIVNYFISNATLSTLQRISPLQSLGITNGTSAIDVFMAKAMGYHIEQSLEQLNKIEESKRTARAQMCTPAQTL